MMAWLPTVGAEANESQSINASEIVLEHIKDTYDWHVTEIGDRSIVINLPVIVKSSTGWHVFSTAEFAHEPDAKGYRMGPAQLAIATRGEHAGKVVELQGEKEVLPFDISITKTVAVMFINVVILLLCILLPARWYRRHKASDAAPGGFTGLVEMLVMYVEDNIIKPGVGEEGYEKYSPYLMTCFFFILVCNIMGVIPFPPGSGNVTGNIAITFFLAVCTFIVTQVSGTKHYWKDIFWPEVPIFLKAIPLMPIIEIFGVFTKPFALMIRLFANMMAGHAVILSFTCVIFLGWTMGVGFGIGLNIFSVLMLLFMNCLELLVAFVQAYVFTLLSAVFIGLAHKEEEAE